MNFAPSIPTSYEFIHYTAENRDTLDLSRTYAQTTESLTLHKPNGLWLSIAGTNDWENYCHENHYNLGSLKCEFQVQLKPNAKILILYNKAVFADFEKRYACYPEGTAKHGENYTLDPSIKWERIINDFQGIALPVILPQFYNMGSWFDIWCCTSACIWDLQAVVKVEKLGIMNKNVNRKYF